MSEKDNEKNELDRSAMLSSRARNRTVMLSSDMTGQVRSLIQNKNDSEDDNDTQIGDEPTGNGFMAPINFNTADVPSQIIKDKKEVVNRNKTEMIGSFRADTLSGTKSDENGFGALKKDVSDYDRPIPASVKEILNTKEFSKGKTVTSDTSTLIHQALTSFDADRSNLSKHRSGFRKSQIVGFLISFDKDEYGEIIEIRDGRSIVTSKNIDQSEMLFIDDDSISNPHAVIKADKKGRILLLDQLSETGSSVIRPGLDKEIDAVGSPVDLRQDDIIRFGSRYFIFCAVPKIAIQD